MKPAKRSSEDVARPPGRGPWRPDDAEARHCGPDEHARRNTDGDATDEQIERAAAIFRAVSEPARLKLLVRLGGGEWCVTELADAAGVGLSTVSQQLRLLRAERIVARRRAGKHIFYSLADAHVIDLVRSAMRHAAEPHPLGADPDHEASYDDAFLRSRTEPIPKRNPKSKGEAR